MVDAGIEAVEKWDGARQALHPVPAVRIRELVFLVLCAAFAAACSRALSDHIEPFDEPNQFARLGKWRGAIWLIGQAA